MGPGEQHRPSETSWHDVSGPQRAAPFFCLRRPLPGEGESSRKRSSHRASGSKVSAAPKGGTVGGARGDRGRCAWVCRLFVMEVRGHAPPAMQYQPRSSVSTRGRGGGLARGARHWATRSHAAPAVGDQARARATTSSQWLSKSALRRHTPHQIP